MGAFERDSGWRLQDDLFWFVFSEIRYQREAIFDLSPLQLSLLFAESLQDVHGVVNVICCCFCWNKARFKGAGSNINSDLDSKFTLKFSEEM